jgi:hypothetical protein
VRVTRKHAGLRVRIKMLRTISPLTYVCEVLEILPRGLVRGRFDHIVGAESTFRASAWRVVEVLPPA